jgi:hypothetical protein
MGSVNYIFANTGQTVRLVIQALDSNGYPKDLTDPRNWLDGYGYVVDGYYTDAPDGYYPDGYHTDGDHSDGYDGPNDGYYVPVVQSVLLPDLTFAAWYPLPMRRFGVGLYVSGIQLPNGVPAIGTYIVSTSHFDDSGQYIFGTYSINAARPFGVTSVTPI